MCRTLKIFFIALVVLLAYDVSVTADSTSSCYTKNQLYKAAGSSMSILQITDLETETEIQCAIRNTPGIVLKTFTINPSSLRANQNNAFVQRLSFSNCPSFIVQHKLII